MPSAQKILWQLAGTPPVEGGKAKLLQPCRAVCCITGEEEDITAPARRALGENFTDHSLWAAPSGRVGQPALWCCSGTGKKSPRPWSWIAAPGVTLPPSAEKAPYGGPGLCLTNRSNTRPIIDILLNPPTTPWVVTVAVSGQKHVLPYAATNYTSAWGVRMEDKTIRSDPGWFRFVFFTALALRRLGLSAEDVQAGNPHRVKTITDLDQWKTLADPFIPYQHAPVTELALWCITKPIMEDTDAYPNP